jgi:hypothetical protein
MRLTWVIETPNDSIYVHDYGVFAGASQRVSPPQCSEHIVLER